MQAVVNAALGDRIPGAAALSETLRRRRATGGPAEQTFAHAGRAGTAAPQAAGSRRAVGAADRRPPVSTPATRVWQHPDLLPAADDLDDPAAFIDRVIGGDTSGIDEAIARLEQEDPGAGGSG